MAFVYGKIVYSEKVHERIAENGDSSFYEFVNTSIIRHLAGDCGLYPLDVKSNLDAIANNQVVISSFVHKDSTNVRIITEPDRSFTTIKYAEEG